MSVKTPIQIHKVMTEIAAGEHLIGKFAGDAAGATLIVFGSMHGNEPGGVIGLFFGRQHAGSGAGAAFY
jgi:hypothetical protein